MSKESCTITPLSPLRKIISARMTEAKNTIPHYRVAMDVEVDKLLALRAQHNEECPENKVSVNDFVIKACANALMEKPEVNIQLVNEEVHQYQQADISVVVAVDGGLSTPIVRDANSKNVQQIASTMKDLSARATTGQLGMNEIIGGTFSISNLGMYGVDQFDAIINPPQCAILAVAAAKPQSVVKNGKIGIATLARMTLSVDHRAIDGAIAAEFLLLLRDQLENPAALDICR